MLNQSLNERFTNAERILQECRDNVPENLKMKLYGLSKQAKEGDCRMPMPPRCTFYAFVMYAALQSHSTPFIQLQHCAARQVGCLDRLCWHGEREGHVGIYLPD